MPPSRSWRAAASVLSVGLLPATVLCGAVPADCLAQANVRTIESQVLDQSQTVRKNQCLVIGENARLDGDVEMKDNSVLVLMDTNAAIDGKVWAQDKAMVRVYVQDTATFPKEIDMQQIEQLIIHFHSSDIQFPVGASLSVTESSGTIGRDPDDAGMGALQPEQVGMLAPIDVEISKFSGTYFFMNTHFKQLVVSESILDRAVVEGCVIEQTIEVQDSLYFGGYPGLTVDLYGASDSGAKVKLDQLYSDYFFIDIDFDGLMPDLRPISEVEVKNVVFGWDSGLPGLILDSFPMLEKLTLEKIAGSARVEMKNAEIDEVSLDEVSTMVVFKSNNEVGRVQCGSKTQAVYVSSSFVNDVQMVECDVMLFTNPPVG